jgi:5-methylcytosine-specific restriction endonuclease McrA
LARKGSTTAERENPRRHVMAFVRQAVYARDENKCVECGQPDGLVLDHLVPVDNGGSDTMSNLRVVCRTCQKPRP